jgi:hypothetical protein
VIVHKILERLDKGPLYRSPSDGEVGTAVRKWWPLAPVVAVTATTTPGTVEGISKKLHVRECKILRRPVVRKNLKLHVQQLDMQSSTKDSAVLHIVKRHSAGEKKHLDFLSNKGRVRKDRRCVAEERNRFCTYLSC